MRTWPAVVLGALIVIGMYLLVVFGRLWSPAHASPASTSGVSMTQDFSFSPDPVTILVGDTVIWTNDASFDHTTTSDTGVWDSHHVTSGNTFSLQFNTAGTFKYHCSIHASLVGGIWEGMVGTVIVQDVTPTITSTPTSTATPTDSPTPTPSPTITLTPNGSVTPTSTRTDTPTTTATPTATATRTSTPVGTRLVYLPAIFNGFGGTTSSPVSMTSSYTFSPATLAITTGTTVTWTNVTTDTPHTTTSDAPGIWDSGTVNAGGNFSFTFNTPGTFTYHCTFHQSIGMVGTITVAAATGGASW